MSERIQRQVTVPVEHAGHRLDQVLADLLGEYSRTRIKEWIDAGEVRVDGAILRAKDRVLGGEAVVVDAALPVVSDVKAEAISLTIVHQDEHVLVVDKPAGLVVHPGAGNPAGTLQNALLNFDPALAHLPRSGIVHRLDKDTSGLLVIARTLEAHTRLVEALEAREVKREYEAICVGVMTGGGTVDRPIDRHPVDRTRMAIRENGRPSVTHYRVIKRYRGHTHVRVQLETGRTHQIRVHLAHIHYPLVGDGTYGGRLLLPKGASETLRVALREFKRQALHAARLEFQHPISAEPVVVTSSLPQDMQQLLGVLARDASGG